MEVFAYSDNVCFSVEPQLNTIQNNDSIAYKVEWNSTNNFGNTVAGGYASGVYFSRLEATSVNDPSKSFVQVRKMLLIR